MKPLVMVGDKGFSEGVKAELDKALHHHELLKVKMPAMDKPSREALAGVICEAVKAERVQSIGRVLVLFRRNPEKSKLVLPT